MPQQGDSFISNPLSQTHLGWGTLRYTDSRTPIDGECYIPIPAKDARRIGIYNSNNNGNGLGLNEFNCASSDGFFTGKLKSAGCARRDDIYAKNFHGSGDLKALTPWFRHCNVQVGDCIQVLWTSSTDIVITHVPQQP